MFIIRECFVNISEMHCFTATCFIAVLMCLETMPDSQDVGGLDWLMTIYTIEIIYMRLFVQT